MRLYHLIGELELFRFGLNKSWSPRVPEYVGWVLYLPPVVTIWMAPCWEVYWHWPRPDRDPRPQRVTPEER